MLPDAAAVLESELCMFTSKVLQVCTKRTQRSMERHLHDVDCNNLDAGLKHERVACKRLILCGTPNLRTGTELAPWLFSLIVSVIDR